MKTNRRALLGHTLIGLGASSIPGISWAENETFIEDCRRELVEMYPSVEAKVIESFITKIPEFKNEEVFQRCRNAYDAGDSSWKNYLVLSFMSYSKIFESQIRRLK